ncbi:MMPL family transporter [Bremerella sp. JC817]|uniref:MMPL family transporter n=1 Tax=Bremerella sp. JC817 TaxID=3231756 RepID=UPI0034574631
MPSHTETSDEQSLMSKPLAWGTRLVVRYPIVVLLVAFLVAGSCVFYATNHLGFKTSRLDLINKHSSFNRLWREYLDQFSADDDVVVIIEGPGREEIVPALEDLYTQLSAENQSFYAVLHERGLSKVREKGLHFLPEADLSKIDQQLHRMWPLMQGQWDSISVAQMAYDLNQQLLFASRQPEAPQAQMMAENARQQLDKLASNLLAAMGQGEAQGSMLVPPNDSLSAMSQIDSDYFLANEGQLGLILLRLVKNQSELAQGKEAIAELRSILDRFQKKYPRLKFGLTGLPVMENDEMERSQVDMTQASVISLVGVAFLFMASFGGLRHPLLAVVALLIGIAMSVGFATLFVGHLNILSVSFGVILIGLGIDFGVHYVARYLKEAEDKKTGEALVQTARDIGPGIVTGGLTTAVAFFTASLTDFTGVAELGIIAGGGLLVCLVASMTVLPASIHLADRHRSRFQLPKPLHLDWWVLPLLKTPKMTLLVSLIGIGLIAVGVPKLRYDHNLLNLQPKGLESVQWEEKLLSDTDRSVWFALSIAEDRETLLERKKEFEALPTVNRVEEIASLMPDSSPQKLEIIGDLNHRLQQIPENVPNISVPQAAHLGQVLADSQRLLSPDEPSSQHTYRRIAQIRELLRGMPEPKYRAIISQFQQRNAGELLQWLHSLAAISNPDPPTASDLPEALVTRFVGKNNQLLLRIYPNASIWDMDALEGFVRQVESVDPKVTGQPLQTFHASRQMQLSYIHAAIYSLIAVMIILLIDFRSLTHTLLALTPVAFGMLMLFGIQGFADIPLNPANMIVLPLILGIGIDDGVHVVHDFRRQGKGYLLGASTATGVIITSLTTMIGFGALMLAEHRGLASLGRVLTIGVACCLFTSLVVLPCLLKLVAYFRKTVPEVDDEPAKPRERPRGRKLSSIPDEPKSNPLKESPREAPQSKEARDETFHGR